MLKYKIQYGLFRAAEALLRPLPHRAALAAAWMIVYPAALLAMRGRVAEARRRVRLACGPELGEREARRAARISLRNTVFNAVEMLRVESFTLGQLQGMTAGLGEAVAKLRELRDESGGRGAIIALPHCGNWDLAGSSCMLSGLPIFSVAGKQRNPYMNRLMNRSRGGHGMAMLERGGGALKQILSRLAAGEVFAILPDTRSPAPDLAVPFLGGSANIARGMASFAWQSKVPILPLVVRRDGWARFAVKQFPPVRPDFAADKSAEIQRMTLEVMAIFDREIRAAPEQWFWYNKRWILDKI